MPEINEQQFPPYHTIVADPPWAYKTPGQIGQTLEHRPNRDRGESRHGAGSVARYGSMSFDELAALRVDEYAADQAHLYLWTTNTFVEQAHEVARAWGFEPKTIVTWGKVKADGSPSMKMGYYFRGATEHFLFATRGPARKLNGTWPTLMLTQRTGHSVKPEGFYDMVEQASPGPYLELFARRRRMGWDAWGNEVESDVELTA